MNDQYISKSLVTIRDLVSGLSIKVKGQRAQTVRLLLEYGSSGITDMVALQCAGIRRLASRMSDLKKAGLEFTSQLEKVASGSRIARYVVSPSIEEVEER